MTQPQQDKPDSAKARKAAEDSAAEKARQVPGAKSVVKDDAKAPDATTSRTATSVLDAPFVPGPGQFPVEVSRELDKDGKAVTEPRSAPKPGEAGAGEADKGDKA